MFLSQHISSILKFIKRANLTVSTMPICVRWNGLRAKIVHSGKNERQWCCINIFNGASYLANAKHIFTFRFEFFVHIVWSVRHILHWVYKLFQASSLDGNCLHLCLCIADLLFHSHSQSILLLVTLHSTINANILRQMNAFVELQFLFSFFIM